MRKYLKKHRIVSIHKNIELQVFFLEGLTDR